MTNSTLFFFSLCYFRSKQIDKLGLRNATAFFCLIDMSTMRFLFILMLRIYLLLNDEQNELHEN